MILVIKHGALGDLIQATEAFRCIREKHKNEKIVLITKSQFINFVKEMPFFDEVIADCYPKINIAKYKQTLSTIAKYDMVYDFQHSGRTIRYYYLLKLFYKLPKWSTIPKGFDRSISAFHIFKAQLIQDGINTYRNTVCLDFMNSDINKYNLPDQFALIVAGCSLRGKGKQWKSQGFASVCDYLVSKKNIIPVFIGSKTDSETINNIKILCKEKYIDLCGMTNLNEIASLSRKAALSVSIDTGPAHIIAGIGCKTIILFNKRYSNPKKSLAIGSNVFSYQINNFANDYPNIISNIIDEV